MRRVLLITGCTILVGIIALYTLNPDPHYTVEQRQARERFLLCRREAGFTTWTDLVMLGHCQVVATDAITGQQRTHFGLDFHRPGA
jgi:hypothetical protein